MNAYDLGESNDNFCLRQLKNMKIRLKTIILFLFWAAAFYPVYPDLVSTWLNHSDNSHGILVPLITAYLIWQKREQLLKTSTSNSKWGALVFFISIFFYFVSFIGAIAVVSRAMIVFSLIGLVWFNFGGAVFSIIQFPLLYLLFMVPVPDTILGILALPLQIFATKLSAFLIQLTTIPVYREGNMLYFVQTQLEVTEACSGLRSMMAFIMLGILFAYIMKNWPGRLIIVFSAIPLAIFANLVRVTGTGILAHFYGGKVAQGFLHDFSGLAVFAFGFGLLFLEYLLLNRFGPKLDRSNQSVNPE
ncbi:MAG: exosortase/archaeosortase family protein [Desulfobacterales bacterium]|nr:exosortase/archaeosortase family protein [Desulfobacterales bacterium]